MPSFYDFALVCQSLSQTQSRLQMAEAVGTFLAALDLDEAEIAARFMVGRAVEQGEEKRLQISGRAVWKIVAEMTDSADQGEDIFTAAEDFGEAVEMTLKLRADDPDPTLTIRELNEKFAEIAAIEGRHARNRKLDALRELFARASAFEGKYIAKILIGEMRHGVSEGLMLEAIARMGARPVTEVRRIHMLEADLGRVVGMMRSPSRGKVRRERDSSPRAAAVKPLKPMLAFPVADIAEAFATLGQELSLEHKLDGARVQIHHAGRSERRRADFLAPAQRDHREHSRRGRSCESNRRAPRDSRRRSDRRRRVGAAGRVSGSDAPIWTHPRRRPGPRRSAAEAVRVRRAGARRRVDDRSPVGRQNFDARRIGSRQPGWKSSSASSSRTCAEAEKFYADAVAAGYEGVMAKSLASAYTPGARGRGWLKIKHTHTLDLVIIAAEWGYGRRHGWLSNYHLAARDPARGGFAMLGKTFKGLSDEQFREMTERLLALKTDESHGVVTVRPEVVVEVAYNDIQRSPNYDAGMALRFARIVRIRDDKSPEQADSIETVTADYERQKILPSAGKV